jgi:hypothetical protein
MYRRWGVAAEPAAYLRVSIMNGCRSYHRKRRTEQDRLPMLALSDETTNVRGELDDIVKASGPPTNGRGAALLGRFVGSGDRRSARRGAGHREVAGVARQVHNGGRPQLIGSGLRRY